MSDETSAAERELLWEIKTANEQITNLQQRLADAEADQCHGCLSISGVYYALCDDCLTRLNTLEAKLAEAEAERDKAKRILGLAVGRNEQVLAYVVDELQQKLVVAEAMLNTIREQAAFLVKEKHNPKLSSVRIDSQWLIDVCDGKEVCSA